MHIRNAQPPVTNFLTQSSLGRPQRTALWTACWLAGLTSTAMLAQAAPLTLATAPPGNGGREPAPNVVVSVDNSGSMGSTGIATLKAALNDTFSATNVPDGRIRLAWQAMWSCRGIPNASAPCSGKNGMKRLQGTHRSNFTAWVATLAAGGWTPSHLTFKAAGDYLATPYTPGNVNSPWASDPGVTELPVLGCRRSYHVFMTDGEWNSDSGWDNIGNNVSKGANADGTNFTFPLPDPGLVLPIGTPTSYPDYSTTDVQTRATRDSYGTATVSTLADLAFYYWSRDLQPFVSAASPGVPNLITPQYKDKNPATVGATTLQPFWNPKNNPATWQNMTTYTIGFNSAATLSGTPTWTGDTWGGAGYSGLVNGSPTWGNPLNTGTANKAHELWHMALNSRGKFVPAPTAASLSVAFKEILDNILADTSKPLVSISASTSSLRTTANVFVAGYSGVDWSGRLTAYPLNTTTGLLGTTPAWYAAGNSGESPTPLTYYGLDVDPASTMTSRLILSHSGTAGISWKWINLPSGQQSLVKGTDTAAVGEDRLNWVRGDKTKEVTDPPDAAKVFRRRGSRLGDIVTSNIWHTGKPSGGYSGTYSTFRTTYSTRPAMIYVGANDGMLHGFDAATGAERLAYVPRGVLGKFPSLSNPSYSHQYFVDGQPFVGDAYLGASDGWQTLLVGTLGGGGKGYFVLNVTNPTDSAQPNVFSEANAVALVKLDTTASSDTDLGHIYSPPIVDDTRPEKSGQIVKMNNDRWAAVMGNGYNSTNEKPVLLVQYLDGDKALVKVMPTTCAAGTCSGDGNGLSTPRLLDLNGDGKVDIAYAGDLKGNLWKFNLTNASPTAPTWHVAFSGTPFFVAGNSLGVRQPIMTAPYTMPHPRGGIMLAFGTGRNVTTTDPTTVFRDTMWGIHDNSKIILTSSPITFTESGTDPVTGSPYGPINTTVSATRPTSLVQQTQTANYTDTGGKVFYDVSRNAVAFTGASRKRGWFMDWPLDKMRVLHNPTPFYGERILVQSTVPQSGGGSGGETCTPSALPESTYISVFNIFTGHPSVSQVFKPVDTGIAVTNLGISQVDPGDSARLGKDGEVWLRSTGEKTPGSGVGTSDIPPMLYEKGLGVRSNWREYQ